MERPIDFFRNRHMLCGACGRQFLVSLNWLDRWEQGWEECPGCAITCEHEDAPRVTVDPDDRALNDDRVARLYWYHTSTHSDWPRNDFDPAADLTVKTRQRMGGDQRVEAWAARQRAKALHIGTYEAAIHNMLRRIDDQDDHGRQFHLYRVHLKPTVVVREGWIPDPSDWIGEVDLNEVCPPGIDAVRYLNYYEDPGGLSLALGRETIACIQQVAVPLLDVWDDDWVHDAVIALNNATVMEEEVAPQPSESSKLLHQPSPRQATSAHDRAEGLAKRLPINLRRQFVAASAFVDDADPGKWARQTSCLLQLVKEPGGVLTALNRQERRRVGELHEDSDSPD